MGREKNDVGRRGELLAAGFLKRKGYEILGYKEGELSGKNWFMTCLPKDEYERVYGAYKKSIHGNTQAFEHKENYIIANLVCKRILIIYFIHRSRFLFVKISKVWAVVITIRTKRYFYLTIFRCCRRWRCCRPNLFKTQF